MKYFLDTEFIEDGKTIDLMSIGIVREDGKTYYAESFECDLNKASQWVQDNVIPHLKGKQFIKQRKTIKQDILNFVKGDEHIEFWGYFAAYDWVVFCQLFGRMIDLPADFPFYCNDFKQVMHEHNIKKEDLNIINQQEHNALSDAQELQDMYIAFECREIK